jgi:iron complex outermembrane recepter protein
MRFLFFIIGLYPVFSVAQVSDSIKTDFIDEVVIEATRVASDAPFSVTKLSKTTLEKLNSGQDIPMVLAIVPSSVSSSDAGTGIGYTGIRIRGTDPSRINVTINGVPLNDSESQLVYWVNTPDILSSVNEIQVQRGVGSSTNGAGAFGGSVHLNTISSFQKPFIQATLGIGSWNTRRIGLQGGYIFGKWHVEGKISSIKSDGYIDRASSDLFSSYVSAARITQKSSLRFIAFTGREKTYQSWYGIGSEFNNDKDLRRTNVAGTENPNISPYPNQIDNYRQTHLQLHYSTFIKQNWKAKIVAHYTKGRGFFEEYKSFQNPSDYGLLNINDPIDLVRRRWLDNDFLGTVFSIINEKPQNNDFILGGGFNVYSGSHFGEVINIPDFSSQQLPREYYRDIAFKTDANLFGKWSNSLGNKFKSWIDLQVRSVNYHFNPSNSLSQDKTTKVKSFLFFNPKAGITYKLSERQSFFVSHAIGKREPNRNDIIESRSDRPAKPETLFDTELGANFNGKNWQFQATAFHMYYHNQLILDGRINDIGAFTRVNIPRSFRAGLELEGKLNWSHHTVFSGNMTFSRHRLKDYKEFVIGEDTTIVWDFQGWNPIGFSPEMIGFFQVESTLFSLGENPKNAKTKFGFSLNSKYVGSQFLDNTGLKDAILPEFLVLNGGLWATWNHKWFGKGRADFTAFNLTNQLYANNGYMFRAPGFNGNYIFPQATIWGMFTVRMEW